MKIRNIVFSGFMASILMAGGAYADVSANSLTNKGYVDAGLQWAKSAAITAAATDATTKAGDAETAAKSYADSLNTAMNTRVTAAEGEITTLNGADTVEGSVAYQIAAAIEAVTGDGDDSLATRVGALETTVNNATIGVEANAAAIANLGNTYATDDELTSGLAGKQNTLTTAQQGAVDSGITATKVSAYDGYAATIAEKADADDVYTKTETDDLLADKQDTLTTAQQGAVDSGITATKVIAYDAYATSKQDTLGTCADLCYVNSEGTLTAIDVATGDDWEVLAN